MNCKPGDIAICIKGRHEGKIGTVVAPFIGGSCGGVEFSRIPPDVGHVWIFEAAGHFEVQGRLIKQGPFPDSWLKPVSGLPEAAEIERRTLHLEGLA